MKLQTVDSEMLHFDFLKKVLGMVSPPHFVHNFSRKIFLTFYTD